MFFYFVSQFLHFFKDFTLVLLSHSHLTLVKLNSFQVIHLDEKHQCELFQLIFELDKLLNKVVMLQDCVHVRNKEISSCKAPVFCSLHETSLNHQHVNHNSF